MVPKSIKIKAHTRSGVKVKAHTRKIRASYVKASKKFTKLFDRYSDSTKSTGGKPATDKQKELKKKVFQASKQVLEAPYMKNNYIKLKGGEIVKRSPFKGRATGKAAHPIKMRNGRRVYKKVSDAY
jgi:hypothetical protein